MAKFPQLPLWTDSYLADTTHLTTEEHGAYLLLLMAAWRSPQCRLPNDDKLLRRFAGKPKRWNQIKTRVLAFWLLEDGYYTQKRLLQEHERASARAFRAALGGNAKSLKYNGSAVNQADTKHPTSSATTTTTIKEESSLSLKGSKSVHVRIDSPHWKACSERYRKEHRRWPPQDDGFGWNFPADWIKTEAEQKA